MVLSDVSRTRSSFTVSGNIVRGSRLRAYEREITIIVSRGITRISLTESSKLAEGRARYHLVGSRLR